MVFHTAAVCAWSHSNSRKNFDRVTAMERHARKTVKMILDVLILQTCSDAHQL